MIRDPDCLKTYILLSSENNLAWKKNERKKACQCILPSDIKNPKCVSSIAVKTFVWKSSGLDYAVSTNKASLLILHVFISMCI